MDSSIINALERIRMSLQRAVGRARIKAANDSGGVQLLQVQLNEREIRDNTPRVGEYGFTSVPLAGCQALVVFVGGDRSNAAVIGTNDEANRLKNLQPGEVAIFDDQGQSVWIKRNGIVVSGAGKPVTITNASKVRIETDLEVTGDIKDRCDLPEGRTMAGMRTIYDTHTHPDAQGGTTGTPDELM